MLCFLLSFPFKSFPSAPFKKGKFREDRTLICVLCWFKLFFSVHKLAAVGKKKNKKHKLDEPVSHVPTSDSPEPHILWTQVKSSHASLPPLQGCSLMCLPPGPHSHHPFTQISWCALECPALEAFHAFMPQKFLVRWPQGWSQLLLNYDRARPWASPTPGPT